MSNENHPLGEYVPEPEALQRVCEAFDNDEDWAKFFLRSMVPVELEKAWNQTIGEHEYRRRSKQEKIANLEDEKRRHPGPGLCAKLSHGMPLDDEEKAMMAEIEREVAETTKGSEDDQ